MGAEFWVAIAFLCFMALIAKKAYQFISEALDKRSARIKGELEEALKLREEAQALLASYQRKQRDAVAEANGIVEHAKAEAARIAEQAERDIEAAIERRTKLAEAKIEQAEAQAIAEVRSLAVDVAVQAARHLIEDNLEPARADKLVDDAITELGRKLN